jgi:hypothetical protein
VWEFKPLPPRGGFQLTQVTLTKVVDLMGVVTSSMMEMIGPGLLIEVSHLRKNFDKSREIDAIKRKQLAMSMEGISQADDLDTRFDLAKNAIQVKGSSLETIWVDLTRGSFVWGKSSIMVKASIEETSTFLWDIESRANNIKRRDIQRYVDESTATFSALVTTKEMIPRKGRLPLYVNKPSRMRMLRTSHRRVVITLESTELPAVKHGLRNMMERISARLSRVSGLFTSAKDKETESIIFRMTKVDKNKTKLEVVAKVGLKGLITKAKKVHSAKKLVSDSIDTAIYFSNLIGKADALAEDGIMFGEDFLNELRDGRDRRTNEEAVKAFIASNRALKELAQEHAFVEPMLCAVVENKLTSIARVETKAECTGVLGGRAIGRSLAISLATNLTAKTGVDEWMHQFPALKELDLVYEWFRPFVEVIGFQLVREVGWGVKTKLVLAATTSAIDLITDVYVTYMFWNSGRTGYFIGQFLMLASCIALQVGVVAAQVRKGSKEWEQVGMK